MRNVPRTLLVPPGWVIASLLLFPSSCFRLAPERMLCAADSASVLQSL